MLQNFANTVVEEEPSPEHDAKKAEIKTEPVDFDNHWEKIPLKIPE